MGFRSAKHPRRTRIGSFLWDDQGEHSPGGPEYHDQFRTLFLRPSEILSSYKMSGSRTNFDLPLAIFSSEMRSHPDCLGPVRFVCGQYLVWAPDKFRFSPHNFFWSEMRSQTNQMGPDRQTSVVPIKCVRGESVCTIVTECA